MSTLSTLYYTTPLLQTYLLNVTEDGDPVMLIKLSGMRALSEGFKKNPQYKMEDLEDYLAFFNEYLYKVGRVVAVCVCKTELYM